MNVTAVILTFNEAQHIGRCISSLDRVVSKIVVVDCFSTDGTLDIAVGNNIQVIQRSWVSHAEQFNWALLQLSPETEWVLRIDADEILTPALAAEIIDRIPGVSKEINGIYLRRRITFQGRAIRHGGLFPVRVLRLFRYGMGQCESRLMDEHIKVIGQTVEFKNELVDKNLKSLTWWTDKHNKYASLEVVDLLNIEYGFMRRDSIATLKDGKPDRTKRWVKENIYIRLPSGFRAFVYFFYRYVIRLGFLDGQSGTVFHFLQGFWYRYLVDAKLSEVRRYMTDHKVDVTVAISQVLGIEV